MPEQPEFEVQVHLVAATEHEREENPLPPWSEIVLEIDGPKRVVVPMTRAAGELAIDCFHEALHPWSGKPMVELLEDKLDEIYSRLMKKSTIIDKGRAQGAAYAVALMRNPYNPDIDRAREEAHARWEERNAE